MHPTVVSQNGFAIIWRRLEITCGDLGGERKCLQNEKKIVAAKKEGKMDIDVFSSMYPAFQLCKECFQIRAEIKNVFFNCCCGTKILEP